MDRLRVWIESRSTSMNDDDPHGAGFSYYREGDDETMFRPPPLRTSSTYDDEEAFTNVALNLLSRNGALGLSPAETIMATIISHRERISFYEALCIRRCRSVHVSPSNSSVVEQVDRTFGHELIRMIKEECGDTRNQSVGRQLGNMGQHPPTAPRGIQIAMSSDSQPEVVEKKSRRRRFFPDSEAKGGGFFRSRKVKNIDWSLAEAVTQVQALRLDGASGPSGPCGTPKGFGAYEPPSPIANMVV